MNDTMQQTILGWVSVQTPSLTPEQIAKEKELRPQLVAALNGWNKSRYEMGRVLAEYRKHFKSLYMSLYRVLGVEERTARNLIDDYERANRVSEPVRQAAMAKGYDIAEKKHEALGDVLAKIKATDEVEITTAVDDAVTAYKKARCEAKKSKTEPDPELSKDYVPEEVQAVIPVKSKAREKLDQNVNAALEWFSAEELAEAIADLVKMKKQKKPVQAAA